jgi:ankyrin repeat protein
VWFEDQQFTSLHKTVLRAVNHDLETQLKLSTSNINEKDPKGRTPIAWAAARGDVKSVHTLLSFGADPEISCDTGNNPLLRSVRAKSPECVKILLEFGADVRRKSTLGFTALHYAAYYRDDDALLKTLLEFGAEIDDKDNYGWTPLSCTAEYDQYKSAQLLVKHGADPNISDNIGWTPITRAVSSNSNQVLKLLIEKGADYCSQTARLETILHFVAARGNIKTIELLTVATLRGLNVDMKDVDGRTASDLFYSREKRSSNLVTAFTNLLISVRNV